MKVATSAVLENVTFDDMMGNCMLGAGTLLCDHVK